MSQKSKFIFGFVAILIIGAILFFVGSGKFYDSKNSDIIFKDDITKCDLHVKSCEMVFEGDKTISLELGGKPLKAGKSLKYSIKTKGFSDKEFFVSVVGVNMNMGLFEFVAKKINEGEYEANALLPTCISGRMTWKISVISKKEKIGANYILELE
ncbi:MAG: hypothetical protein ACK5LP_07250 [Campylobacteraceae bacterium]